MSTLSLRPSFAAQLSALAATAFDFVRAVKTPQPKASAANASDAVDTADIWALYRMHRGADTVAPAMVRRLGLIADAE